MRWGVNISLLVSVSMMIGVWLELVALAGSLDPEVDTSCSDFWLGVYLIALNAAGAAAAACNGAGFFRQRRGASMSRALHLWNGLFVLLYLPGLLAYLVMLYSAMSPETASLFHLAALMAFVPIAAITGVYRALRRRQRVLSFSSASLSGNDGVGVGW